MISGLMLYFLIAVLLNVLCSSKNLDEFVQFEELVLKVHGKENIRQNFIALIGHQCDISKYMKSRSCLKKN